MKIQVGHGRCCITPPLGIAMAGYGARKQGAAGVHDELFVNAVVIDDGGGAPVAVVALDLCLLPPALAAEYKEAVRTATGLAPEEVFLNTSHTHAGPSVGGHGETDELVSAYRTALSARIVEAIQAALGERAPAVLRVGSAPLDIGCNRRQALPDGRVILGHRPDGPTLKQLTVWSFHRENRPDVLLFSVPMHGTTLGGQNLLLSAEWMGMAVQYVEGERSGVRAVFLQGCGADQDPYYTQERGVRGTFAEVEAHGRRAAAAVGQALVAARPLKALPLRTLLRQVELAPKEAGGTPQALILHGLRLGDATMLCLSAEAFVEYARYGAGVSKAAETLVLGYTNGNIGYLCTDNVYAEGGYEANTTRVAPGSEAVAKTAMATLLAELNA
ncbi:MAG: neutral/alkaline non-lysosomal ceramidase N-terminal domain-containing protein [Lentisphaeria bacterium]|nr:neutral/alkaline non-lysosomal ceramidase N-terminal domain-containing protein [Lentisphaeria bacterium]